MSLLHYLKEKKNFLVYTSVLFTVISLFLMTQPGNRMMLTDYRYLCLIYIGLTLLYLVSDYFKMRRFWRAIEAVMSRNETIDNIAALPRGYSTQQKLFVRALKKQVNNYHRFVATSIDKDKDKQNFAMYWAHEIKTPVIASKMLLADHKEVLPEKVRQQLDYQLNEVDRLTMQSLYFARLDSFEADYIITEVNLARIIKDVVKRQATLFISKKIKLTMTVPDVWVRSDSKWLSYVCDQIISNAIKYTPPSGEVTCSIEQRDNHVSLSISDNGPGIASEDQQRVFDKGYTGSLGRSSHKATGMGLYLAKQMALKLGHELSLKSELGKGTSIQIIFETKPQYFMPE
ncbi:sensor histidine kinase [Brochothrix campestris]